MTLHIHSGTSYLSTPKARSRFIGYFYLGNEQKHSNTNMHNGLKLSISVILKNGMSSVAEAEFGGSFSNTRKGEVI